MGSSSGVANAPRPTEPGVDAAIGVLRGRRGLVTVEKSGRDAALLSAALSNPVISRLRRSPQHRCAIEPSIWRRRRSPLPSQHAKGTTSRTLVVGSRCSSATCEQPAPSSSRGRASPPASSSPLHSVEAQKLALILGHAACRSRRGSLLQVASLLHSVVQARRDRTRPRKQDVCTRTARPWCFCSSAASRGSRLSPWELSPTASPYSRSPQGPEQARRADLRRPSGSPRPRPADLRRTWT